MNKWMHRLTVVIMVIAMILPAVAVSESTYPLQVTLPKMMFNADEDISFAWEADTSLVDLSRGFTVDFSFSEIYDTYANGESKKEVAFGYQSWSMPEGVTSGNITVSTPDCVSGEGHMRVYYFTQDGDQKYYETEGLKINNGSCEQDYINVKFSKSREQIVNGDEVTITHETIDDLGNGVTMYTKSLTINASGDNPPAGFNDSGKEEYVYTFTGTSKGTFYNVIHSIGYEPVFEMPEPGENSREGVFTVSIQDSFWVYDKLSVTPVPTVTPEPSASAAPIATPAPDTTPAPTGEPGNNVELNLDAITIAAKQTVDTVKVISGKNITWTSSNEKVATVDADGKIKGVKKGTATITATSDNGESDSVEVTVVAKNKGVKKIKLSKKNATLKQGEKLTLKATLTPADAKNKKVIWTSSNTAVATVNAKGKVKAVGVGEAVITATASSGKTAECKITVTGAKVKKITIEGAKKMKVGETQQLLAKISPDFAENKDVKWKSSAKKIAAVDENGVVTALKKGTVKITATAKDGSKVKATITIKIKK